MPADLTPRPTHDEWAHDTISKLAEEGYRPVMVIATKAPHSCRLIPFNGELKGAALREMLHHMLCQLQAVGD